MDTYEHNSAKVLPPPEQSFCPAELRVPRRMRNLERTEAGCLVMSEENLKQICEMDGLYEFP